MAILVLGAGYIGSALAREALARGERVVALDNFFSSDESVVAGLGSAPQFTLVRGSVVDSGALDAAYVAAGDVSAVYLLAAQASANPLAATAAYTEEVNLRGPRLVLEAMRRHGARTIVFGSATRVYGDSIPADADESTPYGRFADLSHLSKIYVEKLLEMHAGLDPAGALRCLAVRLGLVYGVAPVMKTDYRFMTAPNKFCLQAVRGEPLVVNGGNEVGLIHVADAAGALLFAAGRDFGERYVALNAATEVASIAEAARLVESAGAARGLEVRTNLPAGVAARPTRPLDSRLARAGFAPRYDLRAGIAEALTHFAAGETVGVGRMSTTPPGTIGAWGQAPRLRTRDDDPADATTSALVLLKCRATPEQLADRLVAPAPDGLELYLATEDIDGENWLERTVDRIAAQSPPAGFAIVVEGPLRSLDGEFFDLTRDTPANRLVVERLAALGKALGAGAANVHAIAPTTSAAGLSRAANATALRASLPLLSHYADVCTRAGLAPLVENIPPVARMRESGYWFTPIGMAAEDLVWLRRAVPDVGFTIDLSHAQLYVNAQRLDESEVEPALRPLIRAIRAEARCASLLDYVAVAAEGIVNVHVANATGLLGEGAPYGEGDADLDPVIARLSSLARYIVTETLEPDANHAVLMREAQNRLLKVRDRVRTDRATTDGHR